MGLRIVAIGALAGALLLGGTAEAKPGHGVPKIEVLSNRADLISGGDALIRVRVPKRVGVRQVRVFAGKKNVTRTLARRKHALFGLVGNLRLGKTVIKTKIRKGRSAKLAITNHSLGGPIFAGPQIKPWMCQPGALDDQCNQAPRFKFMYLPRGAPMQGAGVPGAGGVSAFSPYDLDSPPSDDSIAKATTNEGVTVPFIIRIETGYIDRDMYSIATLFDPSKPWSAVAPQPQANHRLVITHGFSCDTEYKTGAAPSVLIPRVLGAGFMVMSNALDHAGHNCNLLTQAESLVMTKEYLIDHYGTIRWTIGSGCSGGSLAQQQVANAYPGIYQGITPQCSFTDAWSSAMEYEEYYFGLKFLADPSRQDPGTVYDPIAISAILDHPNISNPITFTNVIPNSGDPSRPCTGVPPEDVYSDTNPTGVRCTLQDYMVNAFGKDSRGFARRGFDNVGIQYGMKGLRAGEVSAAQFVDLNSHIGGGDIDLNIIPERSPADPIALKRLYRTGAINSANNMDKVAIIDLRGPDPGAFHDVYRTYAMRARLMRNFGTAANQILWRGQAPLIGDIDFADDAVFAMDQWLAQVDADKRKLPLARKIILDKPDTVAPRCTDGAGVSLPSLVCDATVAAYGTPRLGADEPPTDDVMKCQRKPMNTADYPVTFTTEQWARLQAAFPGGVCDYAKPGVSQRGAIPWLTYQNDKGKVIYGGKPLGPAPKSEAIRAKRKRGH